MGMKTVPDELQSPIVKSQFKNNIAEVISSYETNKNVKKTSEGEIAYGNSRKGMKALHASFSFGDRTLSDMYLMGFKNHFLEVRFTYDKDVLVTAEKVRMQFLKALGEMTEEKLGAAQPGSDGKVTSNLKPTDDTINKSEPAKSFESRIDKGIREKREETLRSQNEEEKRNKINNLFKKAPFPILGLVFLVRLIYYLFRKKEEGIPYVFSTWETIAFCLIKRLLVGNNLDFSRYELMSAHNINSAIKYLGLLGHKNNSNNAIETLQRTIQNLKDIGYISFIDRGEYRLTSKGAEAIRNLKPELIKVFDYF